MTSIPPSEIDMRSRQSSAERVRPPNTEGQQSGFQQLMDRQQPMEPGNSDDRLERSVVLTADNNPAASNAVLRLAQGTPTGDHPEGGQPSDSHADGQRAGAQDRLHADGTQAVHFPMERPCEVLHPWNWRSLPADQATAPEARFEAVPENTARQPVGSNARSLEFGNTANASATRTSDSDGSGIQADATKPSLEIDSWQKLASAADEAKAGHPTLGWQRSTVALFASTYRFSPERSTASPQQVGPVDSDVSPQPLLRAEPSSLDPSADALSRESAGTNSESLVLGTEGPFAERLELPDKTATNATELRTPPAEPNASALFKASDSNPPAVIPVHGDGTSTNLFRANGPASVNPVDAAAASGEMRATNVLQQVTPAVMSVVESSDGRTAKTVSLELQPAELGYIRVHLDQTSTVMAVHIIASETVSTDILNTHKNELLNALSEAGIENASVDVSHEKNRDGREQQPQQFARRGNRIVLGDGNRPEAQAEAGQADLSLNIIV